MSIDPKKDSLDDIKKKLEKDTGLPAKDIHLFMPNNKALSDPSKQIKANMTWWTYTGVIQNTINQND